MVVDTREQAADAQRRHPGPAGRRRPGRRHAASSITGAGQRIGAGDRIATRRNDRDLGVANRDTWTVTAVGRDGGLLVTGRRHPDRRVDLSPRRCHPGRAGARVLPADYVTAHVELAYASTAHGVQGDTVTAAHVVVGEHTGAASAYVGMTRGRTANTAHLVAADLGRGAGAVDRRVRPRPRRPRPRPRRRARRRRGRPLRPAPTAGHPTIPRGRPPSTERPPPRSRTPGSVPHPGGAAPGIGR